MIDKRNIQTVAPFLADNFVDLEEPIFDRDEYSNILNQNSAKLGVFMKYLICKLHDSLVIELTQNLDNLKIKLNDFATHVFADAIVEKKKINIPHDNLVFPLTIELKGNLAFTCNTVDDRGFLREIGIIDVDEYLYEQVIKIENDNIEIAFQFWKSALEGEKSGKDIVLIVSARELIITEKQAQAWNEIFGNEYDEYYEHFKGQFYNVSGHTEWLKLIDEYEQNQRNE
jgi:hypothetical protein